MISAVFLLLIVPFRIALADSGSQYYDDAIYSQLEQEYREELVKDNEINIFPASSFATTIDPLVSIKETSAGSTVLPKILNTKEIRKAETLEQIAIHLNCDNPWFWNSIKCLWIDWQTGNYSERTKFNAKVTGILIIPPLIAALFFICFCCVFGIFVRYRIRKMKKYREKMERLLTPGVIELPNGEVKHYLPTKDEISAIKNLITLLASPV